MCLYFWWSWKEQTQEHKAALKKNVSQWEHSKMHSQTQPLIHQLVKPSVREPNSFIAVNTYLFFGVFFLYRCFRPLCSQLILWVLTVSLIPSLWLIPLRYYGTSLIPETFTLRLRILTHSHSFFPHFWQVSISFFASSTHILSLSEWMTTSFQMQETYISTALWLFTCSWMAQKHTGASWWVPWNGIQLVNTGISQRGQGCT